jgi:hypothetical protein
MCFLCKQVVVPFKTLTVPSYCRGGGGMSHYLEVRFVSSPTHPTPSSHLYFSYSLSEHSFFHLNVVWEKMKGEFSSFSSETSQL